MLHSLRIRSRRSLLVGFAFVNERQVSIIYCLLMIVSCLANLDECAEVQHILDVFFQAFGQEVNLGKISIAFSANVGVQEQQRLASFLGV
ncbi:hypothetical protein ACFX13_046385 [Malus domestica]